MAGITLTHAQSMLDKWLAAEEAVAVRGQSFQLGDRQLTRANVAWIRDRIDYWDRKVRQLTPRTRSRTRYIVS